MPYWHQGPEGTATPSAGPDTAPAYCVRTAEGGTGACGDRGCLTGDHLTIDVLRYPGSRLRPGDPDDAWAPPFFPLDQPPANVNCWCCVLLVLPVMRTAGGLESATLRQPAPSPVLHLLWLGTPLPNLPVRTPAADAFTEVLLT